MHMLECVHTYMADGAKAGTTFALALANTHTHTHADTDRCCLCECAVFASDSPTPEMQASQEVPQLSLAQWQQLMKRPPTDCSKLLVIDKAGDFDLHTLWLPRGKCNVLVLPDAKVVSAGASSSYSYYACAHALVAARSRLHVYVPSFAIGRRLHARSKTVICDIRDIPQ